MGSALILQSINFVTFESSRGMFMANGRLKLRISQIRQKHCETTIIFCGTKEQYC